MRRVGLVFIAVCALVMGPAAGAGAREPSPAAAPAGQGPEVVCTTADERLIELSGLVTTASGYVAINDSNLDATAMRVFFLDQKCKVTKAVSYPTRALDPEDLAMAADGTLWVADFGDNPTKPERPRIALWKVPPSGAAPVIHRMTYPDGPHDAEALLLNGDGTPVVVTKEITGTAGVYVPAAPLQPNTTEGVPLKRVGEFKPQRTGTVNPLGVPGQMLVTGGANAPGGKRVTLRTYSDAYEWDVPDGDVVKAITTGKPRVRPLPSEPRGEAIAYTPDGASFVTVSDEAGPTKLLRYPVAAPKPPATKAPAVKHAGGKSLLDRLSLHGLMFLVATIGVIGLALVAVGIVGIRRSRQARRAARESRRRHDGPDDLGASPGGLYGRSRYDDAGNYAGGEYAGGDYAAGNYAGGEYAGGDYAAGEYAGGNDAAGYRSSAGYHGAGYSRGSDYSQGSSYPEGSPYPEGSEYDDYGGGDERHQHGQSGYRGGSYGDSGYADEYDTGGRAGAVYGQPTQPRYEGQDPYSDRGSWR